MPTHITVHSFLRLFVILTWFGLASVTMAEDDPKAPAIAEDRAKAPAAAEEKPEPARTFGIEKLKAPTVTGDQVNAEIRVVKAPRTVAHSLFEANLGGGHVTEVKAEVLKQLAELEKEKKVATIFQPKLTGLSGEESVCESIREALYTSNTPGADGKIDAATEMRPVGLRFAAAPALSRDGKTIYLRLQFEITMMTLREGNLSPGATTLPVNPGFSFNRVDTSVCMTSGTTVLLSVIDDPENNGGQNASDDIELLFLTATATEKKP